MDRTSSKSVGRQNAQCVSLLWHSGVVVQDKACVD
jgi:hypothetical protein